MKILIHAKERFAILMNENFEMKRKEKKSVAVTHTRYYICNYSPSGRFSARIAIVWSNEFAQITKRPDGYLNSYLYFYKHSQSREQSRVDEVYANTKSSSTRNNDIL
jgi:hypothetical protein